MGQGGVLLRSFLCIAVASALVTACGLTTTPAPDLKPASELSHNCFDPPYTRDSHATLDTFVKKGDRATDFTLRDPDGKSHTLSDMLREKPVLLVTGSYTCPRYQDDSEARTKAMATKYKDDLTTAVVYIVEAHPKGQASPYNGRSRQKKYSNRKQQKTYEARAKSARDLEVGNDALVLVDELSAKFSNPFWCTYGTCPSCSFLINQDGTIEAVHTWHDPPTMKGSIDAMLGE